MWWRNFPRPFSKKSKFITGSIVKSFIQFVFIVCQIEGYQQERSQNLKQIPKNFMKDFDVDDITLAS